MLHRRSQPASPSSMATMYADIDLRCIGEAAKQLHTLWPTLHDDDVALLALRGTALRQKLHDAHPLDAGGRCLARTCRSWWLWRRRSACPTHRILVDCGRANVTTLWTSLLHPTGDFLHDARVYEWLHECTNAGRPPTSDPSHPYAVSDRRACQNKDATTTIPASQQTADHSTS